MISRTIIICDEVLNNCDLGNQSCVLVKSEKKQVQAINAMAIARKCNIPIDIHVVRVLDRSTSTLCMCIKAKFKSNLNIKRNIRVGNIGRLILATVKYRIYWLEFN